MPENRLHEQAVMHPAARRSYPGRRTGLFPVQSSFLPRLQLGAVALEGLLVQIEDAWIAGALATIVLARPERSDRWRIVVSGKLGHAREQRDVVALNQGKELQRTATADALFQRKRRSHLVLDR
jgi:hypothetical protein